MLNRLQDVFKSFQRHEVRYVVIGGVASVLYGVPRATFDLDVLIEPTIANAERLLAALTDAGFGTAVLTSPADVAAHEMVGSKRFPRASLLEAEWVWRRK